MQRRRTLAQLPWLLPAPPQAHLAEQPLPVALAPPGRIHRFDFFPAAQSEVIKDSNRVSPEHRGVSLQMNSLTLSISNTD